MEKIKNKVFVSLIGALLVLSSFLMGKINQSVPLLGGTNIGNELYATTTNTQALFRNYTVVQNLDALANLSPAGTRNATSAATFLEGITITTLGTSAFDIYDATSTVANGEWATTTIAHFPASATVGFYPLNYRAQKGVLIEWTGSPTTLTRASTTIIFR